MTAKGVQVKKPGSSVEALMPLGGAALSTRLLNRNSPTDTLHHMILKCIVVDTGVDQGHDSCREQSRTAYKTLNPGRTWKRPSVASTPPQYHNHGPVYTAIVHLPRHTAVVAAAKAPLPVPLQLHPKLLFTDVAIGRCCAANTAVTVVAVASAVAAAAKAPLPVPLQ